MTDDWIDDFEVPDKASEDDTERDGVLSYAAEWHALLLGIGAGLTQNPLIMGVFVAYVFGRCAFVESVYSGVLNVTQGCPLNENGHLSDAVKEPAYSCAGLVLGLFLNGLFIDHLLLAVGA